MAQLKPALQGGPKKIGISRCYNALQFLKIYEATPTEKNKDSFGKLMKYIFMKLPRL